MPWSPCRRNRDLSRVSMSPGRHIRTPDGTRAAFDAGQIAGLADSSLDLRKGALFDTRPGGLGIMVESQELLGLVQGKPRGLGPFDESEQ